MKPFDTLAPGAGSSVAIRAPKTLQAFEMLPQGMTPGAGVSSAAMGGKSYEIPPSMRSAAGALAEHAHQGAKSSGGCGCGGGCGPCGGAKASLMGGASGSGGAGAVVRAPAALRAFEMLPQGMRAGAARGARGIRGYEIPPNANLGSQGLTGAPRAPKAYEMMPGAGVAARGLRSAGCGCGGKCSAPSALPHCTMLRTSFGPTQPEEASGSSARFPSDSSRLGPSAGGLGASLCASLENSIRLLRDEIRTRWNELTPDAAEQRQIREIWSAALRICDLSSPIAHCDAYLPLVSALYILLRGDQNATVVSIYNDLNATYAKCQLYERGHYEVYASGLARVLECSAVYRAARALEEAIAGRSRMRNYISDIYPLEVQVLALEARYLTQCTAPQLDRYPSLGVQPGGALAPQRLPKPPIDGMGGMTGVAGPVTCGNSGSGGCNRSSRTKRCDYYNCPKGARGCTIGISCGPGNWDPPCPDDTPCYQ